MLRASASVTVRPVRGGGRGVGEGPVTGGSVRMSTPPIRSHCRTTARTGGVRASPMINTAMINATSRRRERGQPAPDSHRPARCGRGNPTQDELDKIIGRWLDDHGPTERPQLVLEIGRLSHDSPPPARSTRPGAAGTSPSRRGSPGPRPSRPRRAPAGTGRRRPPATGRQRHVRARATPPVEPRTSVSTSGSNLSSAAGKPASSSRAARRPRLRSSVPGLVVDDAQQPRAKVPLLPELGPARRRP